MKYKAVVIKNQCVACGSCVIVCPRGAIKMAGGVYADIKEHLCVGCKKCKSECPASVIFMEERSL